MLLRTLLSHLLAIVGLSAFILLTDCTSVPLKTQSEESNLTRAQAAARKARLSEVKYALTVVLPENGSQYGGTSEISFQLSSNTSPLRLDFFEGQVSQLEINGQSVAPATAVKKYEIALPAQALKIGPNLVRIQWNREYSQQGQGLHRFTDPETKQVFLYSQFEAYDANRFMPCFDQPDLRSIVTLTVDAPSTWQVITTTTEASINTTPDGRKVWLFPPTPPISTYLFSLHAGPYTVWTDKFEDIPLRLFARPSLAKYVNAKEWFTTTKQGLKFFNDFFALKYPFKKYDQLIVPEFNAGAMENVGAVTFNEGFVHRSQASRHDRRGLAGTILHEMAHMWFGNIVTMAWWNDLWLNESFASYMASLSLVSATEFKEEWQDFFAGSKNWAYWEDGLVTTHPIEAPILDIKQAANSFDGITYGKGASVLKQLVAYMGADNFRTGIRGYFKTHAFGNTTLKDFIGSLQLASPHDLHHWADRWLKQSGTDKLAAHWTCDGARLKKIELTSTPMKEALFRPQTVQLAVFSKDSTQPSVHRVNLAQTKTTVTGDWPCPVFVYPNYQDDGYARVSLDPLSLKYAKQNVSKIPDLLLRTMVWSDLWQMVRDTEMPLNEYIQVITAHMPLETDEILLAGLVDKISGGRGENATILNYWPRRTAKDTTDRLAFIANIETQYLKRLRAANPGTDAQKFWFDSYVGLARTPKGLEQLATFARAKEAAPGLPVDLDRRWSLAVHLTRFGSPAAPALVDEMIKQDSSDRGRKNALSAEAVQPDIAVKQKWVNNLKLAKPKVSLAEARAVLGALFPVEQRELAQQFKADFFDYLKANGNSQNEVYVRSFTGSLMPLNCEEANSSALQSFLNAHPNFSPSVTKAIKVGIQEDLRCQKIRAASAL